MRPLTLLVCMLYMVSCSQVVKSEIEVVSPEKVLELLEKEDIQLVDVRTPEEYEDGYIIKAKNVNFYDSNFDAQVESFDKKRPIIVYCKLGGRSAKSAKKLQEAGFMKIYDLQGGFTRWKKEGHPFRINE